ncbi:MAG: hypothetical protein NUV84_02150 [Candidatus Uhrbacteria bacterium]|nr:hypothetical protein [Candidatus Uhrbacteria bacterium]
MESNFHEIQNSSLFKKELIKFLGNEEIEAVTRPACFIIRLKNESTSTIKRIIVFPPHGFTGDETDLLNPHPEARKARVKILGKVSPKNKGFKPLIKEILFSFSLVRNISTEKNSAYAKFAKGYSGSLLKSWKNWFYVVKESGWGNFHSLVNISGEWVMLLLEKELTDQKVANLKPYLDKLPTLKSKALEAALKKIESAGDEVFGDKPFIAKVLKYPDKILVPVFIQMLNTQETGKHENCTFFALLLKIAKTNKELVLEEVKHAIKTQTAPVYYLQDLQMKLQK